MSSTEASPELPADVSSSAELAADSGVGDSGATWVSASPPKAIDIAQRIVRFPALVVGHRDLISSTVQRELRSQFYGTLLGFLWPLLQPVFMFTVFYFIFTKLLSMKMPDLPESQKAAMGVFMFVGIVAWSAFAESLAFGCNVIVQNGNLIKKLAFPSEILPLNIVLVKLTTMMFGLVMFVLVTLVTPVWVAPDPLMLLWVPVLLLVQGLFTYGLALLLGTMNVFLRDTAQLVGILTMVWMFTTPIFWVDNPSIMPDIAPYLVYIRANPMYHLVYAWRYVLMSAEPVQVFTHGPAHSIGVFSLWALGSFLVGYTFFNLAKRRFADEV